jgi:hypothetical protein
MGPIEDSRMKTSNARTPLLSIGFEVRVVEHNSSVE